jgi:uncharacterized membrane protein YfcA
MSVVYNEVIIQTFAEKLYQQADRIVATYFIIGLLIGGIVGAIAKDALNSGILVIVFPVLGAAIGYSIASPKAFILRLQAQIALCQVQIERNTRTKL